MNPIPHWTKRATTQPRNAVRYIATHFYIDYAVAFRDDAIETANALPSNPELGPEAFPAIKYPNIRKVLCRNRQWWLFYRVRGRQIEIVSIKHILQHVDSPLDF